MSLNKVENLLTELLARKLNETFNAQEPLFGLQGQLLESPKDEAFGDISTSVALKLAAILKRSPRDIAKEIVAWLYKEIAVSSLKTSIEKIDIAGAGFINFYLSKEYFYSLLKEAISSESPFMGQAKKGRRVLVEFVSANPTGPLSVAHGRQAAVGDALCNVLKYAGYELTREYYLNDEGNQINILGKSIALRLQELKGERIEFPEDHYQGEYIIDLAKELYQARDEGRGTRDEGPWTRDEERETRDDGRETIGERRWTIDDCRDYGVKRILEIIKKELEDFGVRFDAWYSQASLQKSGKIEETLALLRSKGFIYDQDSAVWFASTKFGDDKDRVVIKSDGSYTYLAPDIAYHQDKFKRGFDWLINLWGPDHHGYIGRMKAAVEALGREKEALNVVIVQLATLYKDGKVVSMSTRRGEYVTLRQVIDEVGVDAGRFFFLMRRTDSHLDFDLELAKKQSSENPVYYIQYAHARIANILAHAGIAPAQIKNADMSLLKEKEELSLLKAIAHFESCLKIAEIQLDPYCVSTYLQALAESFHRFYDLHRVLVDDVPLKTARLSLILGCKTVIAAALKLLGVSAPEKM